MKTFCLLILSLFSLTSTASQKKQIKPPKNTLDLIPYKTKNNTYIYVNRDKQPVFDTEFTSAELFTSTGFAIVTNSEHNQAIIDSNGKIVLPFKNYQIKLYPIGNLTVVKTEKTYTANHRFWEREFNIFSSSVKDVIRIKTDVFILESQQHLLSAHMSRDEENTYIKVINNNSFLINNDYYQLKNKRAKKIKRILSTPLMTINYYSKIEIIRAIVSLL
ncbi:KWG repeat-containing protein [Myroides injenensis]|uniref:KWG repeat-containing protein n=1 Tax=Myroides injenensis TaxID=1183151 RepID=UPI000288FC4E|nr:KWG repeat-containing protein [Myroides injenensis]